MPTTESVGKRVARLRIRRRYSQTKLALLASTTRDTIASIETERISPSASMLGAIATALDVDVNRLTGRRPDDPEAWHDLVPTIRRALAATDLVVDAVEPRPIEQIRAD